MIRSVTLLLLANVVLLSADDSPKQAVSNDLTSDGSVQPQGQQYSFPPNNTPVTKVYVFGRPIYVRQPFVLPLRDDPYGPRYENPVLGDQRQFSVPPAGSVTGSGDEESIIKEELMKPIFTNVPMRYRLPERQYEDPYQPSQDPPPYVQPKPKYPLPQCYTNDSGFMCCNRKLEKVMRDVLDELTADKDWQTCNVQKIANTLQRVKLNDFHGTITRTICGFFMGYQQQLGTHLPSIDGRRTSGSQQHSTTCILVMTGLGMGFPLDSQENDAEDTNNGLGEKVSLVFFQNRTQSIFNTDFEALAGLGDFASKSHFYHDLICKIEYQGRYLLCYATPNRHHPPTYPTPPVASNSSPYI